MQLNFNILTALYRVLNVPEIADAISGKVLIGEPSLKSQKEDIELKVVEKQFDYLQVGTCKLNIFLPSTSEGRHNLNRLNELIELLVPYLEDASIETEKGTFHFQLEGDEGVFFDTRRDGMSYYTLIIKFQTFKQS